MTTDETDHYNAIRESHERLRNCLEYTTYQAEKCHDGVSPKQIDDNRAALASCPKIEVPE